MAEKKNIALGERLQAERKKRGWDPVELAQRLRAASVEPRKMTDIPNIVRNIERWEAGQVGKLQERWRLLYSTVFDIPDAILFATPAPAKTSEVLPDDEEMERRKLLAALAALGVVPSAIGEALNHIQHSVDQALGGDTIHLDEWEETVAAYGYSYTVQPPRQLLPDLAADLVAVKAVMGRASGRSHEFSSWYRVTSGLAVLLAKTLCDLGQPRQARPWWVTSQQAADMSGDTDLSLWVSGERLVYELYEPRPTPILLRRADQIMERAGTFPCRGLAHVSTIRAQLLAIEGQGDAAGEELRRSAEIFEQLPPEITSEGRSHAGWPEYRLRYTEAWVSAYLGEIGQLDTAIGRARALQPADHRRGRAQLGLLQAFGQVRSGDVSEGVRLAQDVYENHPVEQRTTMVNTLAGLVLDAVPGSSRSEPGVVGYRELLAGERRSIT